MNSEAELTLKYKKAIQVIAASSNAYIQRNRLGISQDDLKRILEVKQSADIEYFMKVSNIVLASETIPSRIVFDDVLNRYIYMQSIDAESLVERIKTGPLLIFMLMYFNQKVLNHHNTKMVELLELVDSSHTEKPDMKINRALEILTDYALVKKDGTNYIVTKVGEAFITPILLKKITDVTMNGNYSLTTVLEFFKESIPEPQEDDSTWGQLSFIR